MGNNHTPEIRFPGFTGDWEQRKLGENSDIRTGPFGSTLHAEDYVETGIPIITTEHFKQGHLPKTKCDIPQVSNMDYLRLKSYKLQEGDIVFSRVGSVDINALVTSLQDGWLFSGRVLRVRPQKQFYSDYLHYLLDTTSVRNDVISRAVGQTMPSINTEILKETKIRTSKNIHEQKQIASVLRNIDDTIALHQQELTTLKQTKQGFLQKMFPKEGESVPQVRFSGFTGDWEQRKLGDKVEFYSGLTYSPDNIKENGTLVLRSSNVKNGELVYADNVYVDPKTVNSQSVEIGDVIVVVRNGSRNLIGKHACVKKKMDNTVIGAFMTGIRSKIPSFTNALLDSNQFTIEINKNLGATINQITTGEFKKMKFSFPSNDEQEKIGDFFKQLDDTITLYQRELDALKETKKAFLQKMFV